MSGRAEDHTAFSLKKEWLTFDREVIEQTDDCKRALAISAKDVESAVKPGLPCRVYYLIFLGS